MSNEVMADCTCEQCGKPFQVVPSRLRHGRGRHCSPACQYVARRAAPHSKVQLECVGCGARFVRFPSQVKNKKGAGKYCTRACRDKYSIGDKSPNWQNGDKVYKRGPRWHSIRRRVLKRDGNACTCCGSTGILHVHHKIPFRVFEDKDAANDESNLITLCPPCHRRTDAQYKWVALGEDGGAIRFDAGGYAWELAREKGMV